MQYKYNKNTIQTLHKYASEEEYHEKHFCNFETTKKQIKFSEITLVQAQPTR